VAAAVTVTVAVSRAAGNGSWPGVTTLCAWCDGPISAKPAAVCRWIFDLLGAAPEDRLDDLFPGSGAVGRAWAAFTRSPEPALWQ